MIRYRLCASIVNIRPPLLIISLILGFGGEGRLGGFGGEIGFGGERGVGFGGERGGGFGRRRR